jgi:hypothetical protein
LVFPARKRIQRHLIPGKEKPWREEAPGLVLRPSSRFMSWERNRKVLSIETKAKILPNRADRHPVQAPGLIFGLNFVIIVQ